MTLMTPVETGVSLEALLRAKDNRAAQQAHWLTHYNNTVISLTLVTPGEVKDSIRYRNCMGVALQACDQLFWQQSWNVLERQVTWLSTGPEALWCVDRTASDVKALCMQLEHTHTLGRLWDIDVFCPRQGLIGRKALGGEKRRCLLCDEPAHACARSRRHSPEQVIARVEAVIDDWFTRD